jgi:hypothetical protein
MGCGQPCMTDNPGACAAGTWVCNGGDQPSCVPNANSQSCYSGASNSAGVGICRAGTQSCIGALGPCTGQVLPATLENCFNDLDDDCDGTVNNGCPLSITTGTPRALPGRGGNGGGADSARCPANSYVVSASFSVDSVTQYLSAVALTCATPTLVRGASIYTVSVTPLAPAPDVSMNGLGTTGMLGTDDCGSNGFVAAWYVNGSDETGGPMLDGLRSVGMSCASGAANFASATNQLTFTMTKRAPSALYHAGKGGATFEDDCLANEVLIGFDGRDGQWIDQLQGICAPLVTVYK